MTSRAAVRRAVEAGQAERLAYSTDYLAGFGLTVGQVVKVDGEGKTTFTIVAAGPDGSVTCTTVGEGAFRSFRPDWLYPATRINRRNRVVTNTVPREIRGRRDAWRLAHGFTSPGGPEHDLPEPQLAL